MKVLAEFPCSFTTPPLRANDRRGWRAHARLRGPVRHEADVRGTAERRLHRAAGGTQYPLAGPVYVRLVWTVADRRRRDAENSQPTLKVWIDGLVDAGILPDDDHTVVKRAWCEIEYRPGAAQSVRVEILQPEETQ